MTESPAPAPLAAEAHRLLAFIYFACAEADGAWTNEETIALFDFLAAETGDLDREQSTALAREALDWLAGVPGNEARLRVIEDQAPRLLGHLAHGDRERLLDNLLELANADGTLSRDETAMHARLRRVLLGPASTTDLRACACSATTRPACSATPPWASCGSSSTSSSCSPTPTAASTPTRSARSAPCCARGPRRRPSGRSARRSSKPPPGTTPRGPTTSGSPSSSAPPPACTGPSTRRAATTCSSS